MTGQDELALGLAQPRPAPAPAAVPAGRVVRVLPDVPAIDKAFDYLVPEHLGDQVRVGTVVRVELHGRRVGGWVVADRVEPLIAKHGLVRGAVDSASGTVRSRSTGIVRAVAAAGQPTLF